MPSKNKAAGAMRPASLPRREAPPTGAAPANAEAAVTTAPAAGATVPAPTASASASAAPAPAPTSAAPAAAAPAAAVPVAPASGPVAPSATSTPARTTMALQHGTAAAGARFVRHGFATTPAGDLAFALGFPHLEYICDQHPDD